MASNWLYIDTAFPSFTGEESTDQKITTIQNYLFMLVEQLRYSLRNLDLKNMNSTAVAEFTGTITEPIYGRIEDDEGNITQLQITAAGLQSQISDANGNINRLQITAAGLQSQISDANGNINRLQITATSLQSQISDANGNISSLKQTATSLQSQISDANGNISSLKQTATSLQSQITNANGDISSLKQTATSLQSQISGANGNISALQQTSASITATVADLNRNMGQTLRIGADGVSITNAGGSTLKIDGGNLNADTVVAHYLKGENVTLQTYGGMQAGYISITGASTASYAIDLTSNGALRLTAAYGALGLYASRYGSWLQLASDGIDTNGTLYSHSVNDLGKSSNPWGAVYARNGDIQTSDRRAKTNIKRLPEKYMDFMDRVIPYLYQMVDGESGRYHAGFIAQDVKAAMDETGIAPEEFGGWCRGTDQNGDEIYMLRYDEFIPIIWEKIRRMEGLW